MMNTQWRLDSKAAGIADAYRKATPDKRRRAALVACEMVVPIVALEGDDVDAALDALRGARQVDLNLRARPEDMAAHFDDEYFRLDEQADETKRPDALRLFSKARAASALAIAVSGDEAKLHEALYEALSAVFADSRGVALAAEAALQ